jgi:hypothetical protein
MIKITKKQIKNLNEMIKEKHEKHILKWNSKYPLKYICPACLISKHIYKYLDFDNTIEGSCIFCPLDWGRLEEFRIYSYMCERENTLFSQYLKTKSPIIALEISKRKFMTIEKILEKTKIKFKEK